MRHRDKTFIMAALSVCLAIALPAFAQEEAGKKEIKPEAKAKAERTVKPTKAREGRPTETARSGTRAAGARGPAAQRSATGRGPLPPNIKERFGSDDMSDLVEVVKVWRMGRELGLSEEQTLKLLHGNDEHRKKTAQLQQQQSRLINELRRAVQGGKEGQKQLQTLLKKIEDVDEQKLKAELDRQTKLLSDLNPQQKAKYYLFRKRFDEDVRGIITGIMRRRQGGEGSQFSGRPGEGPPGQFRGGQDRPGPPRGPERGEHDRSGREERERGDRDVPRRGPTPQ